MSNTENTPEVAADKAVIVKDQKNDVTRPSADTATGKVWAICDVIYAGATEDNPITRARVIKTAEADGINVSTAATQYGRWRKYMGLGKETAKAVVDGEAATKKAKTPKATKTAKAEAGAAVVEEAAVEAEAPTALAAALGEGDTEAEAEV